MGRIETLETRGHLAASPIHLDVPHTSGVDWNPNGILRVIGTSKADEMKVVGTTGADFGSAFTAFVRPEPAIDEDTGTYRAVEVYLISKRLHWTREVHTEQLRYLVGTQAEDYYRSIIALTAARDFVGVFVRGTLNDQVVLADRELVSRIVIEGRRGNDELGHRNYTNSLGEANHVPALMLGGRGNDWVSGTSGDTLEGGSGDDMLIADQCDAMRGGAGDDFLFASSSNFVNGGSGVDRWHGKGTWTHFASIEKITSGLTSIRRTVG